MELYDAIFYRKSTKKYSKKKLSINMFEEVRNICNDIDSLDESIKVNAYPILKGDSLKFIIKKSHRIVAPHYILLTVKLPEECDEEKPVNYFESVGFAGEKLVLALTEMGLATCWVGNSFNNESVLDFVILEENEIPTILIAFGFPEGKETLFRKKGEKIDRKSLKQITKNVDEKWTDVIECVRLSPSYKNLQPWRFYQDNGIINMYMKKDSNEEMNQVNRGIALRHFKIGCKHNNIEFEYKKLDAKNRIKKEYYISII